MTRHPIAATCQVLSIAAIALAVATVVSAVWCGADDATWRLLASSLAVFLGARAMLAVSGPEAPSGNR